MNPHEPPACPTDCPNRAQKQLGKGYSYLFAVIMTGFVASQAISLKADSTHWSLSLEPVPVHIWIPGITLIASILGLDTDGIASSIGSALASKRERE